MIITMMQIECPILPAGKAAKRYKDSPAKRQMDQIVSVEADLRPKAADPLNTAVKQVRLFVKVKHSGKDAIHIHSMICHGSLLTSLTRLLSEG